MVRSHGTGGNLGIARVLRALRMLGSFGIHMTLGSIRRLDDLRTVESVVAL